MAARAALSRNHPYLLNGRDDVARRFAFDDVRRRWKIAIGKTGPPPRGGRARDKEIDQIRRTGRQTKLELSIRPAHG